MERVKGLDISVNEFIENAVSWYTERDFSFALWRLPNQTGLHFASSDNPQSWTDVNIEEAQPGFLFSPFDPLQQKIYLPADELFQFESNTLVFSKGNHFENIIRDKSPERNSSHQNRYILPAVPSIPTDENNFLKLVTKSREEIIRGNFEKIVPSRAKTITIPDEFSLLNAFNKLCELYPSAMVSIFSSPLTGTWVGASPELLVSVSSDSCFHTAAIAGTQRYEAGVDLRSVSWTQKDIEEQALVERYIISCFKKIRLREFEEHGPKTIIAGNVLHLKTEFKVDMVATNFPQLGSIMLKLLHPTSAVCGMPLDASLAFLKANEGYDRQFYSGFLGPLNINKESHLYVNLRCMQLLKSDAILYAGAGVLADSIPEKEWNETELKMNTLGRVIRQ